MKRSKLYIAATSAAGESIGKEKAATDEIKQKAFVALGLESHDDWHLFSNMFDAQREIISQHDAHPIPSVAASKKAPFIQ